MNDEHAMKRDEAGLDERALEPCPFCGKPLFIREGVNAYGRCETEGCWMNARALTVQFSAPKQVAEWNARAALSGPQPADVAGMVCQRLREDWQACLDNLGTHAQEMGMSSTEVSGREYAYTYALAPLSDLFETVPLNMPTPPPVPDRQRDVKIDVRGIALQAIKEARQAGESQEMLARWISERVNRALQSRPLYEDGVRAAALREAASVVRRFDLDESNDYLEDIELAILALLQPPLTEDQSNG